MSKHDGVVPGTLHLVNVNEVQAAAGGKTKGDIRLYPRPSNDPEDPLNWSRARKYRQAIIMLLWASAIGLAYSFPFSVLADIEEDSGIPMKDLVQASGLLSLLCGWGCLFWQPIALTFGRRGVYLTSILLLIPITFWTAYLKTTGEWYAVRVLFGAIMAPIETVPESTIPDLFFAHERGAWISIYVFSIFGSSYFGPLIAGWFNMAFGWRHTIMFSAVILVAIFLIVFFFMEETMYIRGTLEGLEDQEETSSAPSIAAGALHDKAERKVSQIAATTSPVRVVPRKTYLQKLAPFVNLPGRPTTRKMFRDTWLPLSIMVQFPTVFWCGFIYGINISWFSVINSTASPVLAAAPYNFSSGQVGSVYVGCIIGSALGCWWGGSVADSLALRLARRNGGIREPEHRLWPLILSAVLSCVGLIMWGVGAQLYLHWIVLVVGLALLTFAVLVGSSIALSYNIDCFKDISSESTTAVIIIRNTMGFVFSYAITPWYTNMGLQNCFILAGFLSLGCMSSFLIFTWKGKAIRSWSAPRYFRYAEECFNHD